MVSWKPLKAQRVQSEKRAEIPCVRLFPHECKQQASTTPNLPWKSAQQQQIFPEARHDDVWNRKGQERQKSAKLSKSKGCNSFPLLSSSTCYAGRHVCLLALTLAALTWPLCSTGHHLMSTHGPDLDFCPVDYSKLYCNNSRMSQNSVSKF